MSDDSGGYSKYAAIVFLNVYYFISILERSLFRTKDVQIVYIENPSEARSTGLYTHCIDVILVFV